MPTLAQATIQPNLTGYTQGRINTQTGPLSAIGIIPPDSIADAGSIASVMIRCPLYPITTSGDGLRQYYQNGVPQYRLIPINNFTP